MIPIRLQLRGFLSYLDPVNLDLSNLDVACISGANGAGKSSLLDAITWVLFGQARGRNEENINRYADSAEVIFDFEYEHDLYRVQRSNPRGKTSVLEFYVQDGDQNWRSLTEHTLRATEKRIQHTLSMDYETFTNASFFLQGKADQFAQQKPGDRKRILTSILGLEVWEGYRDRASLRRRDLEKELAIIESSLAELLKEIEEEPARRARLQQLQGELEQLTATRKAQETALENQRRLQDALHQQQQFLLTLGEQVQQARQRLEQRSQTLRERQVEYETDRQLLHRAEEITAAYQQWQTARQELDAWGQSQIQFLKLETKRSELTKEIENQRARLVQEQEHLQERAQKIADQVQAAAQMEKQFSGLQHALEEAQTKLAARPALEEEKQHLQDEQTEARAENKRLKDHMDELKARIDQLGETQETGCPLCGQPLEDPQQLIAHLESEGTQLGNRHRANQALVKDIENRLQEIQLALKDLQTVEADLHQQQRQLDQLEDNQTRTQNEQNEWQQTGQLRLTELNRLLQEADYARQDQAALNEIEAAIKTLGYDAEAHEAARRTEEETRSSQEEFRQLENARAALEPLEREMKNLHSQVDESQRDVEKAQSDFNNLESSVQQMSVDLPDTLQSQRDLRSLQERENLLRTHIGGAEQEVGVIQTLRQRLKEYQHKRDETARSIGQLKTLERAFGKDGVPALLIEQALPEIETQANDILDRLTDGQMSVRFLTQRDYKDKKRQDKKDTLDILISDAAGYREYELFSGGEAFRINFAIRLALSRVLSQRAGGRLQMLVIDEGFGSQDSEGRQRLIEIINMVRDDFARILVITHLEELKDAFPARIEVEKTPRGSTIQVIT